MSIEPIQQALHKEKMRQDNFFAVKKNENFVVAKTYLETIFKRLCMLCNDRSATYEASHLKWRDIIEVSTNGKACVASIDNIKPVVIVSNTCEITPDIASILNDDDEKDTMHEIANRDDEIIATVLSKDQDGFNAITVKILPIVLHDALEKELKNRNEISKEMAMERLQNEVGKIRARLDHDRLSRVKNEIYAGMEKNDPGIAGLARSQFKNAIKQFSFSTTKEAIASEIKGKRWLFVSSGRERLNSFDLFAVAKQLTNVMAAINVLDEWHADIPDQRRSEPDRPAKKKQAIDQKMICPYCGEETINAGKCGTCGTDLQ